MALKHEGVHCHIDGAFINELTEPQGVIYVHVRVDGKWGNVPICTRCWRNRKGDQEPPRVMWEGMKVFGE